MFMLSEVRKDSVLYQIVQDKKVLWEEVVHFGRDAAHRAGGAAFQAAAHKQEYMAKQLREQLQVEREGEDNASSSNG